MLFIGIDLAWTYKNETGICVMNDSGLVLRHDAAVFSDEQLVELILSYEDQEVCVGMDCAIIVNNENGSRPAEGLMMRDSFHGKRLQAFNSNRQYLEKAFGTIRGEKIWQGVASSDVGCRVTDVFGDAAIRLMEVFPTGVCVGLFPDMYPMKYKYKGKMPFEKAKVEMDRLRTRIGHLEEVGLVKGASRGLLDDLDGITRKAYKHLEDKADAFLCAYGMYSVWKGLAEQRIYGDERDGFMMVPVIKRQDAKP